MFFALKEMFFLGATLPMFPTDIRLILLTHYPKNSTGWVSCRPNSNRDISNYDLEVLSYSLWSLRSTLACIVAFCGI